LALYKSFTYLLYRLVHVAVSLPLFLFQSCDNNFLHLQPVAVPAVFLQLQVLNFNMTVPVVETLVVLIE